MRHGSEFSENAEREPLDHDVKGMLVLLLNGNDREFIQGDQNVSVQLMIVL
jgi:hypothetical protein